MNSKFLDRLYECSNAIYRAKGRGGFSSIWECFMSNVCEGPFKPPFDESFIVMWFPVLEGTPYTSKKMHVLIPMECQMLGELSQIPYGNNRYEYKIEQMINYPLTKDMFKGHSLALLKEHCKLFSPFQKKCDILLEKLEKLGGETIEWEGSTELIKKIKLQKELNLQRFLNAQDYGGQRDDMSDYQTALAEIKAGNKKTHWIWYVFPQMAGLGHSEHATFYGIKGRDEAYAYMEHPILSSRLIEATQAVLDNKHTAYEIFGQDTIKFRSCMLLFSTISDHPVFKKVIQKHHW